MLLPFSPYLLLAKIMFIFTIIYGVYAFTESYIIYRIDKATTQHNSRLLGLKTEIETASKQEENKLHWIYSINKGIIKLITREIYLVETPDPISAKSIEYLNMTRGDANPMKFYKVKDTIPKTPMVVKHKESLQDLENRLIAKEFR